MSGHPLDRAAWSALSGPHRTLALGRGSALRYRPSIGPLTGIPDVEASTLDDLAALVMDGPPPVVLIGPALPTLDGIEATCRDGVQMLLASGREMTVDPRFVPLDPSHWPQMLELAQLTNPGPFESETPSLGQFWGYVVDGRLAAMAGERMRLDGFVELSGVAVHPDFRGQGLGAAASRTSVAGILRRGARPFLHCYADNRAARDLYAKLGFDLRAELVVTSLKPV